MQDNRPRVPVLFIDVDGTIRKGYDELGRFVNGPKDVEIFPGVPDLLGRFREAGWRICAVTNQGGVALGLVSFDAVILGLLETCRLCHGMIDKIAVCPHHPNAKTPEQAVCWCRKPRIGALTQSVIEMSSFFSETYPPHLALMVGDREEDEECAKNAGIRFLPAREWRELEGPALESVLLHRDGLH